MSRGRSFTQAMFAGLALGCGGALASPDGGADAGADARPAGDAGYTACTSPGGYTLCNGSCSGTPCPPDKFGTPGCRSDEPGRPRPADLGICSTTGGDDVPPVADCELCPDGHVCALSSQRWWSARPADMFRLMDCGPQDWAIMYTLAGRPDMARYADRSAYTSQPLPSPATCPSVPGLTLCGGPCGGCPSGYVCVGRSPLHPYSLCVNDGGQTGVAWSCDRNVGNDCKESLYDRRCLTFKVDDASQPVADGNSLCVDRAICEAAAKGYPGGAFCTGGN